MRIIDIPNDQLIENQKAYNCSIVEHRGTTLLFYRFEFPSGDYNTDLAVCELDRNWKPLPFTNRKLRLARWSARVTTLDDPRAFIWKGKPTIIYPQGQVVPTKQGWLWTCSVAIAQFSSDMRSVEMQYMPRYGNNINASSDSQSNLIAAEKNWSPFILNERLLMCYSINPLVVIEFNPLTNECVEVQRQPKIEQEFWQHGDFFGGGTPLIRRGDEFVGFFHTFSNDHPHRPNCRTYHVGFFAISATPPFKLTRISTEPIMTAKPEDAMDLRGVSAMWRPNCVYPCGILERDGMVYMSYGWQDCRCKIAEMSWREIEEKVLPIAQLPKTPPMPPPAEPTPVPKKRKKKGPRFTCSECGATFERDKIGLDALYSHACQ